MGARAALCQPRGVLAPGAPRQVPLPGGNVLVLSVDGEKRISKMVSTTTAGKTLSHSYAIIADGKLGFAIKD